MKATRRDLLKYFGIGTVIAPLASGLADLNKAAVIIEPPKVEIATPQQADLHALLTSQSQWGMVVDFRNKQTGEHFRFTGDTFVTHVRAELVDVTRLGDTAKRFEQGRREVKWTMDGVMTSNFTEIRLR